MHFFNNFRLVNLTWNPSSVHRNQVTDRKINTEIPFLNHFTLKKGHFNVHSTTNYNSITETKLLLLLFITGFKAI